MEDKEIFIVPHAGGNLLYAPLQGKVMFSKEDFKEKTKDELFDILMRRGANVYSKKANMDYLKYLPSELVILLTRDCNLRCRYCYSQGGDSKEKLRWPAAKKAIEFSFNEKLRQKEKRFTIDFVGGGEPTLNWDVLIKSVSYAKELCKNADMELSTGIITNGAFNNDKCEWIIENIDRISISFDILKDVQNNQRPLPGGMPSYDLVLNNIKKIDANGIRFGIRSTISRDVVNLIPDMARFVSSSFKHVDTLLMAPVFEIGRCYETDLKSPEKSDFAKYFLEAKDIGKEHGINVTCNLVNLDRISLTFCKALSTYFGITPDACVTACQQVDSASYPQSDVFIYGKYDTKNDRFNIDLKKIDRLRKRRVDKIPKCTDCFAKYQCCGGCSFKVVMNKKDLYSPDTSSCEITKSLLAKELYDKTIF
ncbi:radical SAM protein [archaeon]|nr:radical SAM protein [archaeon]